MYSVCMIFCSVSWVFLCGLALLTLVRQLRGRLWSFQRRRKRRRKSWVMKKYPPRTSAPRAGCSRPTGLTLARTPARTQTPGRTFGGWTSWGATPSASCHRGNNAASPRAKGTDTRREAERSLDVVQIEPAQANGRYKAVESLNSHGGAGGVI